MAGMSRIIFANDRNVHTTAISSLEICKQISLTIGLPAAGKLLHRLFICASKISNEEPANNPKNSM